MILRQLAKTIARRAGVALCSTDRIGVDFDADIIRLCGSNPIRVILDVGANEGQSATFFRGRFPSAHIYSFEPVASTFQLLKANTASDSMITCYHYGLGDYEGQIAINRHQSSGSNSVRKTEGAVGSELIRLRRLDDVVSELNIARVDLLKIDVEGFELDVLRGAAKSLEVGRFRYIYAECVLDDEEDAGHTALQELQRVLNASGYATFAYYAACFTLETGSAMGNALFLHRSSLPDAVPGRVRNVS